MENNNQDNLAVPPVSSQAPAPLPVEPKKKMKWWKKILLGFVIFILVIVVAAFNLPRVLTLLFPGDAVLADQSQVLLQKVSVPDQDNGFFDLFKINNCTSQSSADCVNLVYSTTSKTSLDDIAYTNYTKPIAWNQELVDEALQKNSTALDLFSQAAEKQYFQVPDYSDPKDLYLDLKLYPMNSWRAAARFQAIKALSLSYQGKPDEALQEAVKINKVAHNIIVGHNSFIGTLVGIAMENLGSQTILQILPYGSPSKQALADVQASIKSNSDNIEGYKDAFRFEYTHLSNSINETTKTQIQDAIGSNEDASPYKPYVKYGYYYKINQTKNLYTNLIKTEVDAVGVRCELEDFGKQVEFESEKISKLGWRLPFTENVIGKLLFSITGLSLGSAITKECQNDLVANVAQIELALKQYKMDTGMLPGNLDALVPTYLDSVPLDPFDHQPIRYSSQKGIIYSVGLKKQDLGGSEGEDWTKMENPTFHIKF